MPAAAKQVSAEVSKTVGEPGTPRTTRRKKQAASQENVDLPPFPACFKSSASTSSATPACSGIVPRVNDLALIDHRAEHSIDKQVSNWVSTACRVLVGRVIDRRPTRALVQVQAGLARDAPDHVQVHRVVSVDESIPQTNDLGPRNPRTLRTGVGGDA